MSARTNSSTSTNRSSSGFPILVLAIVSTASFYLVAPQLPAVGSFVERYFCSHPLEYISTLMFFGGMAVLYQKVLSLRHERGMLQGARHAAESASSASPAEREQELQTWCSALPRRMHQTQLYLRIGDTLHYVQGSSRVGLQEHLRYLAELAGERLQQTYATIRTITWAIPILGFLGTVIGITMAIANVTPEQLDSSLGEVTGGLAVAFDTTALALGMSIVLVFCSFAVERGEQRVLNEVEQFSIDILLPWFSSDSENETGAGAQTQQQAALWTSQLASLREAWGDILSEHAGAVRSVLEEQVSQTLQLHRETTSEARDTYSEALRASATQIVNQAEETAAAFDDRIVAWTDAMLASSQGAAAQTEAIHDLGAILLRMAEAEERLTTLQGSLNENLEALRIADTMEQTAHSLTAAVHVLTAKTNQRAAA